MARRLEDDQWAWYYRTAPRTVIQACGRVVRAPDDYGATYLADTSLLDLFERARADMPAWFEAQVDRTSQPELPGFDPAAAGNAASNGPTTRTPGGCGRSSGDSGSRTGGSSGASGDDPTDIDDHPLSDVWGDG